MKDLTALPKAELHLHIEGTLEPELAFALAARNGITLPFTDVEALRRAYAFNDLPDFLDLYYACMTVLRTRADFAALATAYLERAHADGVAHVEMFFDPQVHVGNGVPIDDVIDGLRDALTDAESAWGITGGLILCFLRDRSVDSAHETLDAVAHRIGDLLAVGLDSAEVGYPPSLFEEVFDRAAALGLHRVAHAGEEGPPSYVAEALDLLHAERVDHGIRSVEDPALLARLAAERIPLTVCPLSNVRLRAVDTLVNHPIPQLLDAGVIITINSDDPAYFGGYVGENLARVAETFAWTPEQIAARAADSITASFADDARKSALLDGVEAWLRAE